MRGSDNDFVRVATKAIEGYAGGNTLNAVYALTVAVLLVSAALPSSAGDFENGLAAYDRGDYAIALRLWRPLAEHGNATAQFKLGFMYRYGIGVAQDYEQAVFWFRKAAAQGDAGAQNNLGRLYEYGYGVAQDYKRALSCYRKAAAQRDASAQNSLSILCDPGQDITQEIGRRCEASAYENCY